MYKFLTKNGQAIALGLGLFVVAVFLITTFSGLSSAGYDMSTDLNKLSAEEKANISFFNPGLALTLFLAVLAVVLAFVVFAVMDLIKFPKSAMKIGLGLLGLIVVFFILYSTADPEGTGKLGETIDKFNITPNVSRFISAGIFTTLGLLAFSALFIVFAEVKNIFK